MIKISPFLTRSSINLDFSSFNSWYKLFPWWKERQYSNWTLFFFLPSHTRETRELSFSRSPPLSLDNDRQPINLRSRQEHKWPSTEHFTGQKDERMTPGGTFNRKTWNNASSLLLTISPIRYPGPANFLSVLSFHSTNERCNFHPIDHRRLRCPPLFANEMLREKRREVANLINSLPRIQQSSFFFLSRKKWKSLSIRTNEWWKAFNPRMADIQNFRYRPTSRSVPSWFVEWRLINVLQCI